MHFFTKRDMLRILYSHPRAPDEIARSLVRCLEKLKASRIVVLCIGTDRATGDALGPLVGSHLVEEERIRLPNVEILGTLDDPVHGGNLDFVWYCLKWWYPSATVVAVDSTLGRLWQVETIAVGIGSIRPGAGVDKVLAPVGDIYVTGCVNLSPSGDLDGLTVLQNTRLRIVMRMAKVIAAGIAKGLREFVAQRQGSMPKLSRIVVEWQEKEAL